MRNWVNQGESLGAEADLDYSYRLLRAVQSGVLEAPLIRVYRPEPTVSFGQQDTRMPGFAAAQDRAREHGFVPAVRRAGGRAAAYHRGSLVVDHCFPVADGDDSFSGFRERFEHYADRFAALLRRLGADARVGEIPGEYCPGEFSVHARRSRSNGKIKIIGTAQRVTKGAWLFSSSLVIEDSAPIRAVLTDVYDALELELNPATAGAADDAAEGITVESVVEALLADELAEAHLVPEPEPGLHTLDFAELLDRVPRDLTQEVER
ncbi:lipoate--protein ligase family protein [Citricoccus muralis]|uniref:Lipoate--protein ligase family protein n=1 Tax=Citricoccus muralis TaxID=169134 RepID=A0ABY8H893_9MICC|nr:lipoate--protein ligase family protein [Citricoccus muralis]WFP16832.1 lipoate--protein ligase family protein [Citricoccus muralis]